MARPSFSVAGQTRGTAPEDTRPSEPRHPAGKFGRHASPEKPNSELHRLAVGPAAQKVVQENEARAALARHIRELGRCLPGGLGSDPIGVQGQVRVEQLVTCSFAIALTAWGIRSTT